MRYYHYLQKAGLGRMPRNVLLVDAVAGQSVPALDGLESVDQLKEWYATLMVYEDGEYRPSHTARGESAAYFWNVIGNIARNIGAIRIISYRSCRVMALLDLWEMLNNESLTLRGNTSKTDSAGSDNNRQPKGGYAILSDQPNILKFRIEGIANWLTWVDCRNYSAEPDEDITRGQLLAHWLQEWWTSYVRLCHDLKLGAASTTIGGQALQGYKRSYMQEGIYCHTTNEATELELGSYYGGRCEVYRMGNSGEPLYYMDIRSAYGSIMQYMNLPVRLIECKTADMSEDLAERICLGSAIALVNIETDRPVYPVRRGEDVIYPVGRFHTYLAGPELAYAWKMNDIVDVLSVSTYVMRKALAGIANALLGKLIEYRLHSNKLMSTTVKSLIVSLVGKFGQKCKRWIEVEDKWGEMQWGEWCGTDDSGKQCRYRSMGGFAEREIQSELSIDAVPAMSAFITAECRMLLWQMMRYAGKGNVYYVDTDACMVNEHGYNNLIRMYGADKGLPGQISLRDNAAEVDIRGIKYYVKDGVVTCAGVPKGAIDPVSGECLFRHEETPTSAIRAGQMPRARVRTFSFNRPDSYKHGIVGADGWTTPITLKEW